MEAQKHIDPVIEEVDQRKYNPLADDLTLAVLNSIPFEEHNESDTTEQEHRISILRMLSTPPQFTTVRVNTLNISLKVAEETVRDYIQKQYNDKASIIPFVYQHPILSDLLIIKSIQNINVIPASKEVIVSKQCGASVMRGANVYVPGVVSVNPNIVLGEKVAVYADINNKCLRGCKMFKGIKTFLGNGIAKHYRKDLFQKTKLEGLAVEMVEQIHNSPSLGDLHPEFLFLQNLPSVVCSHVLCPPPNSVVLDMCAAPGGKTTHIATLMKNTGLVIAIDRSQAKIDQIETRARLLNLNNIKTFIYDSSKIVLKSDVQSEIADKNIHQTSPPFPSSSFEYILLDAPCSALGQRPQLGNNLSVKCLKSFPIMQRKLFENAIELLKVGGKLVYSTCTIVAEENEMMVKWVLQKFKEIKLVDSQPKLGFPGLLGCGLGKEDCGKMQRFGPVFQSYQNSQNSCSGEHLDTIGFFIATFTKIENSS